MEYPILGRIGENREGSRANDFCVGVLVISPADTQKGFYHSTINCGEDGGVSLKVCKPCMHVRYCDAKCQRNHWPKHKKECKE